MEHSHGPSGLWALVGAAGSLTFGLFDWLSSVPIGTYISAIGVAGSICIPLAKLAFDRRFKDQALELKILRGRIASAELARDAYRDLVEVLAAPIPPASDAPAHEQA